jgi:hypothetical protein
MFVFLLFLSLCVDDKLSLPESLLSSLSLLELEDEDELELLELSEATPVPCKYR